MKLCEIEADLRDAWAKKCLNALIKFIWVDIEAHFMSIKIIESVFGNSFLENTRAGFQIVERMCAESSKNQSHHRLSFDVGKSS